MQHWNIVGKSKLVSFKAMGSSLPVYPHALLLLHLPAYIQQYGRIAWSKVTGYSLDFTDVSSTIVFMLWSIFGPVLDFRHLRYPRAWITYSSLLSGVHHISGSGLNICSSLASRLSWTINPLYLHCSGRHPSMYSSTRSASWSRTPGG